MTLTPAEERFLSRQTLGHLATVGPGGTPQVKPVGFTYNRALGTVEVSGFNMASSAKYRNVQANPKVSFVVDEVTDLPQAAFGGPDVLQPSEPKCP